MYLENLAYYQYGLVFLIGILVSFINSIAGGGSSLSLPFLIFLGLPGSVANGTNRIGIFWGNLTSFIGLFRKGHFQFKWVKNMIAPVIIGAVSGALVAVDIPNHIFKPFLGGVLVFVSILTLRGVGKDEKQVEPRTINPVLNFFLFLVVGFYGGLIQIGVGYILIFALRYASRLDLVKVNAMKAGIGFVFIFTSMLVFVFADKVVWPIALVLSAGCALGGWLGSYWQIKKGHDWIKKALVVMSIVFAAKLVFGF